MGLFNGSPGRINSRGDILDPDDSTSPFSEWERSHGFETRRNPNYEKDPAKRAEILLNWLTAGGPPKPLDPSKIFGEAQKNSGVRAKAAAGQGMAGLFGFGSLIGDLTSKLEPLKPVEPMNQSPMQTGVPYSVPPVPGVGK